MDTNFLKLYIDLNVKLLKTMTIKSEESADAINQMLLLKYGAVVDFTNPASWKYYLNIAGEYHFDNKPMRITSLDTLEIIDFNKSNIEKGSGTANAYVYGSRYYYNLLELYPENEQLIMGILYPVDINKAIQSENGTILGYPKELVEQQEQTLIADLESYIKKYLVRWHVKAYGVSDNLYNTSQHAIMYLNLIPILINLRAGRAKTREAHSFHIREYLASHGGLDKHMEYLTLEQTMFLYRNIRYIERHSGSTKQFASLVENLLTKRQIPLTEFTIKHLDTFDEELYPNLHIKKKPLNTQYYNPKGLITDLDTVCESEYTIEKENESHLVRNKRDIEMSIKNSRASTIKTKIVESNMYDFSNSEPDTLEDILLRNWVSTCFSNLYNTYNVYIDPKTLGTRLLSAKDAFIYMQYLVTSSYDITVTEIPKYLNCKQRRLAVPALSEILEKIDKKISGITSIASNILGNQTDIPIFTYNTAFYTYFYNHHKESIKHWHMLSNIHGLALRQAAGTAVSLLYEDRYYDLAEGSPAGMTMNDWLSEKNLPIYNYTKKEADKLIFDLFNITTGLVNDQTQKIISVQKVMLTILKQLSSYSIQILKQINDAEIRPLNWSAVRLDTSKDQNRIHHFSIYFPAHYVTVERI